jgi:hypothetical protein
MASPARVLRSAVLSAMVVGIVLSGIADVAAEAQQAKSSGPAPVPRETGQFTSGGTLIWLRVADDGSVLVFAARGFRSAFAHPSVLTGDETARWADLLRAFLAADSVSSRGTGGDLAGGGARAADTIAVHGVFGDGDVTVDERTIGQAATLVMRVGATGPAPTTAVFSPLALPAVVSVLRTTAELSRSVVAARQAPVAAAAGAAVAPGRVPPAEPGAAERAPASAATTTAGAGVSVAPPLALPTPGAARSAVGPSVVNQAPLAFKPSAPTSLVSPIALQRDPPSASPPSSTTPVIAAKLPSQTSSAVTGAASSQIGHVTDAPDSRIAYSVRDPSPGANGTAPAKSLPATGDSTTTTPPKLAGRPEAAATARSPGGPAADSGHRVTDSAAAGDSVAEKALNTGGRLPPSVLGDVIRQRQQLLQYCYTEFGLHADTTLAGQIVVRLVIQQDGTVSDVTVPRHNWTGRGAEHVESCIRERVLHWQFPAAQRASTHEIQLIFGR